MIKFIMAEKWMGQMLKPLYEHSDDNMSKWYDNMYLHGIAIPQLIDPPKGAV